MDKKEIKYIGHYDTCENDNENRNYSMAGVNKIDYICKALSANGFRVKIVSPSRTKNNNFYKGKRVKINNSTELKLFPTFPWGNKLQKLFSLIIGDFMLFWYLLTKVKKNETILAYHSLDLRNCIRFAKKIKGFKVVLEVEEIYQDVVSCSHYTKRNEYKNIENADKFIFPTELLNEKINNAGKPYSIIYGTYQVEENRKLKFDDGKIHVVYAGTFDPIKGGGMAAVAAAEYLSQNYHVHIIGFGSEKQTANILEEIAEISKKSKATITYDGLLKGEAYIQFLQKCHIGLSTQIPDAKYNETSFPSKILSYMSNGLRVVSVRIKAIERSKIGEKIYYYDKQEPEVIAKSIMSIDITEPYDSRELIKKLDGEFVQNIRNLLEK